MTNQHTCPINSHQSLGRRTFRELVKKKAKNSVSQSSKDVFDNTADKFKDLADESSLPQLLSTIQRSRRDSNNPGMLRQYESIKAFTEHLKKCPELLKRTSKDGSVSYIEVELIETTNLNSHLEIVTFACQNLLCTYIKNDNRYE